MVQKPVAALAARRLARTAEPQQDTPQHTPARHTPLLAGDPSLAVTRFHISLLSLGVEGPPPRALREPSIAEGEGDKGSDEQHRQRDRYQQQVAHRVDVPDRCAIIGHAPQARQRLHRRPRALQIGDA